MFINDSFIFIQFSKRLLVFVSQIYVIIVIGVH